MVDSEKIVFWKGYNKINKTKQTIQQWTEYIVQNFVESTEWTTEIPLSVIKQEEKAIRFFRKNREVYQMNNLDVVKQIQKLRAKKKITYTDLGEDRYEVTMLCGNKTITMYFPSDIHLSDHIEKYPDWHTRNIISKKETSRGKLWSKEWINYLEQQEKLNKKLISKKEFFELAKSLYPKWSKDEQILAFMLATGAKEFIRLSDVDKEKKYQLAINCATQPYDRCIQKIDDEDTAQILFFNKLIR